MQSNRSALSSSRLFFLLFVCVIPLGLLAEEEPQRGRLPDGRAYRTDSDGTQLVDYIAELELNVEVLNRRVQGLESEVAEKERTIGRVESGQPRRGDLGERDLIENEPPQAALPVYQDGQNKRSAESEQQLRRQLEASNADLEVERQLHAKELAGLKQQVAGLEASLNDRTRELTLLQTRLAQRDNENESLREREAQLKKVAAHSEEAAIPQPAQQSGYRVTPSEAPLLNLADKPESRASFSAAKGRAVDSVRGSTLTELNRLNALIATRNKMYSDYNKQRRSVSFQPAPAVSSARRDVKALRAMAERAADVHTLSAVRSEINEIKAKMNDDIGLMRRTT